LKSSLDFIFAILYYSDRDWFFERSGYEGERKRMTVKRVIEYPHMDGHTNYKLAKNGKILDMRNGVTIDMDVLGDKRKEIKGRKGFKL